MKANVVCTITLEIPDALFQLARLSVEKRYGYQVADAQLFADWIGRQLLANGSEKFHQVLEGDELPFDRGVAALGLVTHARLPCATPADHHWVQDDEAPNWRCCQRCGCIGKIVQGTWQVFTPDVTPRS